jgi:hypothetical protein
LRKTGKTSRDFKHCRGFPSQGDEKGLRREKFELPLMFASIRKTRGDGEKPEMYPLLRLYRRAATEDRILQLQEPFSSPG